MMMALGSRPRRQLAVALLLSLTMTSTAAALFHNRLTKSAPEKDSVLTSAPAMIRLWFAEPPEPALSGITLLRSDSSKVGLEKLKKTDPLSVGAALSAPLAPGTYTVQWKASGKDGHVIRGSYQFRYAP